MKPLHEQLRELADDLSQDPRRLLIEAADRLELVEGLYEDQLEITRNWKLAADARWDRIQRLEETLEEADAVARENLRGFRWCCARGQEPLMRRIQRLEEAGDRLAYWYDPKELRQFDALNNWKQAKEAKP